MDVKKLYKDFNFYHLVQTINGALIRYVSSTAQGVLLIKKTEQDEKCVVVYWAAVRELDKNHIGLNLTFPQDKTMVKLTKFDKSHYTKIATELILGGIAEKTIKLRSVKKTGSHYFIQPYVFRITLGGEPERFSVNVPYTEGSSLEDY